MNSEKELRETLARGLEKVRQVMGEFRYLPESRESDRQAGEQNGLTMAISVVRNDPEDPLLRQIDRIITGIQEHEPGVVIPDARKLRFNPRPPTRRPL